MTRPILSLGARRPGGLLPTLLLALTAVVAACADSDASSTSADTSADASVEGSVEDTSGGFPLTITDSSGVELLIEAAPQRIISYSPGATEVLFAIGAGDRIIAADRFSDYPAAAGELPKLEYLDPDPEAVLAHDPDLVLMAGAQRAQLQQFRDLAMTVLLLEEADSVEGVFGSILLLGELTGNERQAEALARSMRERIEAVTGVLADVEQGPRVFYELAADLYTASPDTFIGGMLQLLKAQNVARGAASPFPQLSAEAVIDADPEVVLLSDAEYGESLETVAARPGWAGVSAVLSGRVHAIDPDIVNRPGPRIVEGIEAMARALYPDRFRRESE